MNIQGSSNYYTHSQIQGASNQKAPAEGASSTNSFNNIIDYKEEFIKLGKELDSIMNNPFLSNQEKKSKMEEVKQRADKLHKENTSETTSEWLAFMGKYLPYYNEVQKPSSSRP